MSVNTEFKTFASIGAKPHYNPDRPGKVEHIALDLKIDFDQEIVTGVANITLNPLRDNIQTLELNAVEMSINDLKVNNVETKFDYYGTKIFMYLPTPTKAGELLQIQVNYVLEKPRMGITFVKPTNDYPDKPTQLWTQGESEQSRYWYPCFDYPLQICTSEITIEIPDKYTTVSNGLLVDQQKIGPNRLDHWLQDQPHPSYLMALTIGEFVEIKDHYKDIPVNYYAGKGLTDRLRLSGSNTPKMMEFFSQKFGVGYPWKKYSQIWIHDYIWGGMENTTATFNTERALVDERAKLDYDFGEILVAHELAHQWFGDYIVIEHWSHLWIKEGAATYSEYLWTEKQKGKDDFNYYKLQETREYLDEDSSQYRRPIVTNVFKDSEDLYDRHSYSKGGLMYNMIRAELGDQLFEKSLQLFLTQNQHQNVDTKDFLDAIEQASGKNLKHLFDQYVFRGGHPDFKISFSWDNENKLGKLTVTQKQAKSDTDFNALFDLKIPVDFVNIDSSTNKSTTISAVLHFSKKEQSFYFPLLTKPDFVSFDPGNNYIKIVELDFNLTELKNQLLFDQDIVNKIYAAESIAKKSNLEALKILSESLKTESFWAVRAEVIEQIGKINLDQTVEMLLPHLADSDPRVRKSTIESLAKFYTPQVFEAVYKLAQKCEPSYFTESAAIQAVGTVGAKLRGDYQTRSFRLFEEVLKTRAGWNEIVRSGAIVGLSKFDFSVEAVEKILEYTKPGVSQYLRIAALGVLGKVSSLQETQVIEKILDTLAEASKDSFISAERAIIISLGQIKSPKTISLLSSIQNKTLYGRIRNLAQENIHKASANLGPEKSISQLREEMDEIKKQNRELLSRLEELEAKKSNS